MSAPAFLRSARLDDPDKPGHDVRGWRLAALALAAVLLCGKANAGAWPVAPGQTLAILKYEGSRADEAFDGDGGRTPMPERSDAAASLYVEHGLTTRLTFQGQAGWTRGEDGFADYAGRGPLELGLRYALMKRGDMAISLYVGAALAGAGRNAGYAAPGAGETDVEGRMLVGRSFTYRERPAFAEIQIARLARSGLPDETRLDLTLGVEPGSDWLILTQVYAGQAEGAAVSPLWVKMEVSAVRRFGDWRLQAGWRSSIAGRDSPVESGPVVGLWRAF